MAFRNWCAVATVVWAAASGCSCGAPCAGAAYDVAARGYALARDRSPAPGLVISCADSDAGLATTNVSGFYSFTTRFSSGGTYCPTVCDKVDFRDPFGEFQSRTVFTYSLKGDAGPLLFDRRDGG